MVPDPQRANSHRHPQAAAGGDFAIIWLDRDVQPRRVDSAEVDESSRPAITVSDLRVQTDLFSAAEGREPDVICPQHFKARTAHSGDAEQRDPPSDTQSE